MLEYQDMVRLWGEDGLLYLPPDRVERMTFDLSALPPEAAIPAQVPLLFTAYVEGDFELFNVLEIQVGENEPLGLLVLGAVPDEKMYYCLDGDSGAVMLLDLGDTTGLEVVNSTLGAFVEFLYHLERLIRADQGKATRALPAARLREELSALDPAAFTDTESWWNVAFAQLEGRT
ncbi:SUKH-4 family immunity protein [Actinomadura formosensis]|uniref:SUKH-4 family immunity protein n=1 Tax=Actinomadura formosensis TaxID=60706 RepID=UPI000833356F|nr:SUKH-4 family immunity protein [Actinomadura formosensis]